uniref:Ig-like domain-containing protein n=1 Tax=Arion vulgaris TaxID=1028688 RepID=A0A0B7AQ15_9EUPU
MSVSSNVHIWLFCVSLLMLLPTCDSQSCNVPPIEEGSTTTISCNAPTTSRNVTWLLEQNGQFVTLTTCDVRTGCNNVVSNFSSVGRNSSDGRKYESVLTISSAKRSETTFKCLVDGGLGHLTCTIEIYVKPETPICNSTVALSTSEVAISCMTNKVYPVAICMFKYLSLTMSAPIHSRTAYTTTPSVTRPGYNSTVCTLIVDVTGIKPGNYSISLQMLPYVTKVATSAISYPVTNPILTLMAPSVGIARDCPNGPYINNSYIDARFGAEMTCRCEMTDVGIPFGQAVWYGTSEAAKSEINMTDRSATIRLTYNSSDPNPMLECRAKTVLNTTYIGYQYRPKYAIGPQKVNISVSDPFFNLCPSNNRNATVMCTVPTDQVNPEPKFNILMDGTYLVLGQTGQKLTEGYTYSVRFRPQSSGDVDIICRAENSIFTDLYTSSVSNMEIREPPKAAPKITLLVEGTAFVPESASIKSGETITVTCIVDGGLPIVQSVFLQCGYFKQDVAGNRATLVMTATASISKQICTCKAVHVTGCYDQVATISLLVDQVATNSPPQDSGGNKLAIIAGLSGGFGCLAIVLAVVLIVLLRRRRRRRSTPPVTYVPEPFAWKENNEMTSGSVNSLRYGPPPEYSPPDPHNYSIYTEIKEDGDYIYDTVPNIYGNHNGAYKDDYIQPIP